MTNVKIAYSILSNAQGFLSMVKQTINELGYEVSLFRVSDKLIYTDKDEYDAVILEPNMTSWGWLDIMLYMRHQNIKTPIILFSTSAVLNKAFQPLSMDTSVFLINDFKALKQNFNLILDEIRLPKKQVLFVDDDLNILRSYERLLKKSPWKIFTVNSAKKAIDLLSKENIDLIVTDIKMPEMHGFELITKIREKSLKLPIIVCSGYHGLSEDVELQFHNVAAFLEKPISMNVLKEKISAILA
jgi:DNA-binding NtrC family response regulator